MRALIGFCCAAIVASASTSDAQGSPAREKTPWWADTTGESPIYPVGEAVPVYRTVLDLLYRDGARRPPVIIMWDTAERRSGGPCPVAKCLGPQWTHKSKIDTATILAFARLSPKRPRIRDFGYPVPIELISQNDVQRMTADGAELLADHRRPEYQGPIAGFWVDLERKYPGAWGVTILSKVGFNRQQTEALINVHQWCGDNCSSDEILFLKKTGGRWRVAERIPNSVNLDYPTTVLRYVGPGGEDPSQAEVLAPEDGRAPPEATARSAVYRLVIDSLYSFYGEHPKSIVFTEFFRAAYDSVPRRELIDKSLAQKFSFLRRIRAPLDTRPRLQIPSVTLSLDSLAALRAKGTALDRYAQTGVPLDLALANRYPDAWGIVSMSRVAFNSDRSVALVYTFHTCGERCNNGDTWLLQRTGSHWHIVDRIPSGSEPDLQVEPLRYVGLDANANAYRKRRLHGVVTDYNTGKPIPFLDIDVRRMLNSGVNVSEPSIRTDSLGRYTVTRLPLNAMLTMNVPCRRSPHMAWTQPFAVTAGMDTAIDMRVDYTVCDTTVVVQAPPAPSPLSGAQAFISADSARFVFPVQNTNIYYWNVPLKGAYEGGAEYMWGVRWDIPEGRAGKGPYLLWLLKMWKATGERSGSLKDLIAGVPLSPMLECMTCDGAVYEDPRTDHSKVFATVENGQLIFVIRGADAVRRIFPTIPATVRFEQTVRHGPMSQYGPGLISASQEVLVNCRNSDKSPEKNHCDLKY